MAQTTITINVERFIAIPGHADNGKILRRKFVGTFEGNIPPYELLELCGITAKLEDSRLHFPSRGAHLTYIGNGGHLTCASQLDEQAQNLVDRGFYLR